MTAGTSKIAVIGAGSWGTALGILLARNGHTVTLWGHESDHQQEMIESGSNERYLPGVMFPASLTAVLTLDDALDGSDEILVVVPSHAFATVIDVLAEKIGERELVWATKGLEPGTHHLLHEVIEKRLPGKSYGIISGPTFAKEVASGLPTAVTIASHDQALAMRWTELLRNDCFRAYTSDDIVGLEIGGSVKNIMAIAAGIADGLGFGANTRAALISRGLHEIMKLGCALGGQQETFMGLSGLGDLVLTCTDDQSRNRRFGLALASGQTQQQALESIGQVVEGLQTASEIHELAREHDVEMPITEQIYRVLFEGADPKQSVQALFQRQPKAENL